MNLIFKELIEEAEAKRLKKKIGYDDIDDYTHVKNEFPGFKIFLFDVSSFDVLYETIFDIEKYILYEWDQQKKQTSNFTLHVCFFVSDSPEVTTETPTRTLCKIPGSRSEYEAYTILDNLMKDLKWNEKVPIEAVGEKYFIPFVYTEKGKFWKLNI